MTDADLPTAVREVLILKLLAAHLAADFILQTRAMVEGKSWLSRGMLLHIAVVWLSALLLTWEPVYVTLIAALHWLIDGCKTSLSRRFPDRMLTLFLGDQVLHVLTVFAVVVTGDAGAEGLFAMLSDMHPTVEFWAFLLALALVIWPSAFMVSLFLGDSPDPAASALRLSGRLIGQVERVPVLILAMHGQYIAIALLFIGKALFQLPWRAEDAHARRALGGTLLSFAIALLSGMWLRAYTLL